MLYNTQEGVPTGWNTLTLTDQFGDNGVYPVMAIFTCIRI